MEEEIKKHLLKILDLLNAVYYNQGIPENIKYHDMDYEWDPEKRKYISNTDRNKSIGDQWELTKRLEDEVEVSNIRKPSVEKIHLTADGGVTLMKLALKINEIIDYITRGEEDKILAEKQTELEKKKEAAAQAERELRKYLNNNPAKVDANTGEIVDTLENFLYKIEMRIITPPEKVNINKVDYIWDPVAKDYYDPETQACLKRVYYIPAIKNYKVKYFA